MSSIKLSPASTGSAIFTIEAPATSTNRTLSLPDQTGTVLTNAGPFTANASASAGAVTIDASNNVGIGTSSPSGSANYKSLTISGTSGAEIFLNAGATNYGYVYVDNGGFRIINPQSGASSGTLQFHTANTERARITSAGYLLVGTTSNASNGMVAISYARGTTAGMRIQDTVGSGGTGVIADFYNSSGTSVGAITHNSSNTTYGTSSDYRLKENVQPMVGALARVAALKPCTYTWKATQLAGEGFIAHELAEVVPDAVVGEKDAVNEDGSIKPQSIDTSFLVATLTAAIQELNAKVEAQAAEIAALKGAQ